MTTWQPFNLNNYVRVKLTEHGHRCHRYEHDEFWKGVGKPDHEYLPLAVDSEGYCQMQMWVFMKKLGQFIAHGGPDVIEDMNVLLEIQSPCHVDPQPSTPSETTSEETPSRT